MAPGARALARVSRRVCAECDAGMARGARDRAHDRAAAAAPVIGSGGREQWREEPEGSAAVGRVARIGAARRRKTRRAPGRADLGPAYHEQKRWAARHLPRGLPSQELVSFISAVEPTIPLVFIRPGLVRT